MRLYTSVTLTQTGPREEEERGRGGGEDGHQTGDSEFKPKSEAKKRRDGKGSVGGYQSV